MDLSVTDAYEVENHVPVSELRVGRDHRGTGGDDIIIDYHPTLGDRPQQHEIGMQAIVVDALQRIIVERDPNRSRDEAAHFRGEVEAIGMPAPWRGDNAPVFRIANESGNEFGRHISKHRGMIGRGFYLQERHPLLAPLELRDIIQRADTVQRFTRRQVATGDVVA